MTPALLRLSADLWSAERPRLTEYQEPVPGIRNQEQQISRATWPLNLSWKKMGHTSAQTGMEPRTGGLLHCDKSTHWLCPEQGWLEAHPRGWQGLWEVLVSLMHQDEQGEGNTVHLMNLRRVHLLSPHPADCWDFMRTKNEVKVGKKKPHHPIWPYSEALRWGPTAWSSPFKKDKLNHFPLTWAHLDCHWCESEVERQRWSVA
jgi:hypothetical protein